MSSLLLIDLGNTRLKWATAPARPGAKITPRGALAAPDRTSLSDVLKNVAYQDHAVVVSCVVPKWWPEIRRGLHGRKLIVVEGNSPHLGFGLDYPEPLKLGADRLADAAAAQALGIFPAITINSGTATVFNVLDARGKFTGGVILPGWQAQLDALVGRTAQLPEIDFSVPKKWMGKSTEQSLQAGALLSFRGGIRATLSALLAELKLPSGQVPAVYLTGGNLKLVGADLPVPVAIKPLLTFTGLHIIGLNSLHAFRSK